MKRPAVDSLKKPRAKKPAVRPNMTLHAFFHSRHTRTAGVDAEPVKNLKKPKAKKPANRPNMTLHSFFHSQHTPQTADAEDETPAADEEPWEEEADWVKEELTDEERVALSKEQQRILKMVVNERKNIFFTGSAGTGKSLLLREIIGALRNKYYMTPSSFAICASTGMAAQNIGGTTIHAWGAVAPGVFDLRKHLRYIRKSKPALGRWLSIEVLIIDEISMVDGRFFNLLAALSMLLRKNRLPFGGIQLVVTGDFFQLPPVTPSGKDTFFAFQSDAWKASIDTTIMLNQVFRQKDNRFVTLLNEFRRGEITPAANEAMMRLSRPLPQDDGIVPTELFSLRSEVERANALYMSALPDPTYTFTSYDWAQPERQKLLDKMMAVKKLDLKVGAQVMLVKNVSGSPTLVNGSIGKVLNFQISLGRHSGDDGTNLCPLVEFRTRLGKERLLVTREEFRAEDCEGKVLAVRLQVGGQYAAAVSDMTLMSSFHQIPLILAWAISIHKAQGQTIERVKVDLNNVFEKGQSYVALSRASSMEGLQVLGFDARKVMAHPEVIEWSKTLEQVPCNDAESADKKDVTVSRRVRSRSKADKRRRGPSPTNFKN
ncbi:hypothetical protein VMCG_04946 [Cytospora schulzeri]|uniref:ATP-dependent DNA helicase PIF1 n=1 Tax=Cytospora schulzeri TaxID=448051 RepID=A0A423WMC8_9PEZI|nr:hypothetical protein VMCG_04946 [Valsa malicola]